MTGLLDVVRYTVKAQDCCKYVMFFVCTIKCISHCSDVLSASFTRRNRLQSDYVNMVMSIIAEKIFFFPEEQRYLAHIETVCFLADSRCIRGTLGCAYFCLCDCIWVRCSLNGNWAGYLTCCQGCGSIIFIQLRLYLCVAMIDLQRIGFLHFLWTCRSISLHFSLPSKFNLTYIKRLTPLSICGRGKSIQSNRALRVCKWMCRS